MKSRIFPIAMVAVWLILIVGLSTSVGSWDHSKALLLAVAGNILPNGAASLSAETLDLINFFLRKLAHFSEYAILFSLAYWMSRSGLKLSKAIALPLVLGSIILFAVSDEVHQSFVPGRTPQVRDVVIDSLGALSVALVALNFDRTAPSITDDPS